MSTFESVLKKRHSVRAFLPTPLSEEALTGIFELAQNSPSNCNTQPWQIYVVSGEACDRLRTALYEVAIAGSPPSPDFPFPEAFDGAYRRRQVECGAALYGNLGIERQDIEGREKQYLLNFRLFEAPHAAFIGMPRKFGVYQAIDVGIYLQTLMLSMTYYGVACCAQAALYAYPDVIRKELEIPEDIAMLLGVSFGYEDLKHPANATRTTRASLADAVAFFGETGTTAHPRLQSEDQV